MNRLKFLDIRPCGSIGTSWHLGSWKNAVHQPAVHPVPTTGGGRILADSPQVAITIALGGQLLLLYELDAGFLDPDPRHDTVQLALGSTVR